MSGIVASPLGATCLVLQNRKKKKKKPYYRLKRDLQCSICSALFQTMRQRLKKKLFLILLAMLVLALASSWLFEVQQQSTATEQATLKGFDLDVIAEGTKQL